MTATLKRLALLSILAAGGLAACGKKETTHAGGPARVGVIEAAFRDAAHTTGVPVRFLMATAFLESRLSPQRASAHYISTNGEGAPLTRGTLMTQTAFGLTDEALGLDPAKDSSQTLEVQIEAYARYVASKMQGLNLAAAPANYDDKYYWIENLANLQRSGYAHQGQAERRNIRVIFAHELIDVLNEGFIWQDPNHDGEKLELTPESPKLDVEHFPPNAQLWLDLDLASSEIRMPYYAFMSLTSLPNPSNLTNHPRRVEVVHCPLSLSACLELQDGSADNDDYVHLAAHYIVPSDRGNDPKLENLTAIQVATHEDVVILTNKLGEHQPVDDAIVIMLTGDSGRIVNGRRDPALPTWFNDQQLRNMGQLINEICTRLSQSDPTHVSKDKCLATSGDDGIQFRHQDMAEEYRWGDIPDFDADIFNGYVAAPGGLGTEVAFEFAGNKKRFNKGETMPLTVLFNATVKTVEMQLLVRCASGQVAWMSVHNQPVRGEKRLTINETRFDSGPNRNGEQFYRALVYGQDGKLIGWRIERVVLATFEKEPVTMPDSTCAASG